ncbi:type II toxin-antitoxin system VapC family toxin [Rhizobium sp. BR 362]|uniref:type II toxin-antitoxin system VapC family toxin n=1 Tax=Rhizobium sp. BR 362 TaxID=3040670 RepID=UPI002F429CC2
MRLLLDTHIVLAVLRDDVIRRYPAIAKLLDEQVTIGFVSVASLWEIAIKTRLGKLDPGMPLADIAGALAALRISVLPIDARHAVFAVDPEPETRDPFDRLLLAQCQADDMQFATVDRMLADHPLALKF